MTKKYFFRSPFLGILLGVLLILQNNAATAFDPGLDYDFVDDPDALWVPGGTMYTSDDGSSHPYHCPDFNGAAKKLLGVDTYSFIDYDPDAKIQWDRITRYYDYYVPKNIPPDHKLPLLFVLHGGSADNYKMYCNYLSELADFLRLADGWKFIVVFPNGTSSVTGLSAPRTGREASSFHWNDCRSIRNTGDPTPDPAFQTIVDDGLQRIDDVGFIAGQGGLIDAVTAKMAQRGLTIDQQRVYVAGASNGGMMTLRLALEAPERITAVAAFIALFFYDYLREDPSTGEKRLVKGSECIAPWEATKPRPMFLLNGSGDQWVDWESGYVLGWLPTKNYTKRRCLPWMDKTPIYSGYGLAPKTYLGMLKSGEIGYTQYGSTFTDIWPGSLGNDQPTEIQMDWFYLPNNPHIQTLFFTALDSGHNVPTVKYELMRDACIFGDHIAGSFETPEMAWLFLQQYRFDKAGNVICDPLYDDPDELDSWCEFIFADSSIRADDPAGLLYRQRDAWKRAIK